MAALTLSRIHFLIHGFCYAGMAAGRPRDALDDRFRRYLAREDGCAERWRARLAAMGATEGLAIVPWAGHTTGPAGDFYAAARAQLGDRFFMLDAVDIYAPQFWSRDDAGFREAILQELAAACVGQQLNYNQEELATDLHSLACVRQFHGLLHERGLAFDPGTAAAEAWGASFDGCVTKYSVTLRRLLGLAHPIAVNWPLTVPDAFFLLDAGTWEAVLLAEGLRLFLFRAGTASLALYTVTAHALSDGPLQVRLPAALTGVTVRSKQGTRLWPQPERYELLTAPLAFREPPQEVVQAAGGGLRVPVSAGFVYRLAKAPAYIFAPAGMGQEEFATALRAATIVQRPDA